MHLRLLFEHVLAAVQHIHRHRIVHRDIKADNVMVGLRRAKDGQQSAPVFVVADFGEALDCETWELDAFKMPYPVPNMSLGGAADFMAPEVAGARPGPRSVIDYSKVCSPLREGGGRQAGQATGQAGPAGQAGQAGQAGREDTSCRARSLPSPPPRRTPSHAA